MPNSLSFRLLVAFALWILLVLPITAFFLIASYRGEIEESFEVDLNQYLTYLIGSAFPDKNLEIKGPSLGDPQFSIPNSGSYWQIKQLGVADAAPLRSESLPTDILKLPSEMGVGPDAQLIRLADIDGPEGQKLRVIEREVAFSEGAEQRSFSYAIALDRSGLEEALYDFAVTVAVNLLVLGAGLMAAAFFIVRYGLWPLRDIGSRLSAIRSGEAQKLEGALPLEILPLQQELNALISSNNHIIERARTHVGNLAHALKTPLSVILNEARLSDAAFAEKISEQAALMRQHIDHHLNRARIAAGAGAVGSVTLVAPAMRALTGTLERIYAERAIAITSECTPDLKFQGEKQDFEEMAGNLLDNACKWAQSAVRVSVTATASSSRFEFRALVVTVDDDGPGMTAEQRENVITRGRRYDETRPGTGLGLSIVTDLADLYQGKIALEESPMGGLRARLTLPAA